MRKLLIANRGEIACRIARSARRLGLAVATVHSAADRSARHVREIGESIELGAAPATASYLRIEAVVDAARRVGAGGVHPGYGFLSESAAFARAVEAAGLVFVGPRAETIERLGGKASAKREAARLGLPVIDGGDVALADPAAVAAQVRRMALPVLLKAVAGGGGRGMAVVESLDGLDARIEGAMREAAQAFGRGDLIVERYLPRVRHLEVQIAGDGHGAAIHLFERECTLQRRHQKLIEEAPSAGLAPALVDAMRADACRLAAAVRYRGLGTVEFVVADGAHRFLEVNPRLQVEHPVTEAVTGLDLVELQLRIAEDGRLPLAQADVRCHGHAFEARVCAEDPDAGFRPATGRIALARFPGAPLRVESAVESGDEVTPHYDSMIAKLVAHAASREAARALLQRGLADTVLVGVATNLAALQTLLDLPETRDSTFHTRLVDERFGGRGSGSSGSGNGSVGGGSGSRGSGHVNESGDGDQRGVRGHDVDGDNGRAAVGGGQDGSDTVVGPASPPLEHVAAAALHWLLQRRADAAAAADLGCWTDVAGFTGWRLGTDDRSPPASLPSLRLLSAGREWAVRFGPLAAGDAAVRLVIGERAVVAQFGRAAAARVGRAAIAQDGRATDAPVGAATGTAPRLLLCDDVALEITLYESEGRIDVASARGRSGFEALPQVGGASVEAVRGGELLAPMMGKVAAIRAAAGDRVAAGQIVIVLESMKMELQVDAPFDGTVQAVRCAVGQMVERGAVLAEVAADAAPEERR